MGRHRDGDRAAWRGLLVDNASWRWIFAINVPLVLATLALVRAAVPESIDEQSTHRIDYLGAVPPRSASPAPCSR